MYFAATSLAGGQILLTWSNVPNAEIYRVYSGPATNLNDFTVPTTLMADNITSNSYIHLPEADGDYGYVVTASRRGAEGTNSIVRVAVSDRTPPPAPTNVAVQLAASGLQITWQPGAGETPDHFNVYRNGALIRTVSSATPVIDNPPRGEMTYTVGGDDALGNEAMSLPVTIPDARRRGEQSPGAGQRGTSPGVVVGFHRCHRRWIQCLSQWHQTKCHAAHWRQLCGHASRWERTRCLTR